MNGTSAPQPASAIEQQLDELHRQSVQRQEELRLIAAELPAAMSRRALARKMVRSVSDAPDKVTVAKRTILKVLRTPIEVLRRDRTSTSGR